MIRRAPWGSLSANPAKYLLMLAQAEGVPETLRRAICMR